ncbi:MAG: Nitrogen permease regulator 2 [Thelocarpon impressellum]|nr:MAG: Nitrogen permease regulator 2 [Thelocarpon impressellum]
MIKAIFFSQFLAKEGPKILHQVPANSITPSPTSSTPPLFDADALIPLLIPRQELCDRLVCTAANRHRVVGQPVCIASRRYARNELLFNFALVLDEAADPSRYLAVVRKLARLFRALEEQGGFLTKDLKEGRRGKVYALCEIVLEDLNNYCECMIPIDEFNTVNIKLFPLYPPPPAVRAWHVPLSTVRLESLMDVNWDLTMQKIVPFIDGINSVRRIAELADTDYKLVKKCVEHLLYYGCLLMLDVFQFGAVYAPTPEIDMLLEDAAMQDECAAYIASSGPPLPPADIVALYMSLHVRLPLRVWAVEYAAAVASIDLRRFITFGCIKGFLYRVQKYAFAPPGLALGRRHHRQHSHGLSASRPGDIPALPLARFLDGTHCFDEICAEMQCSEKELLRKLKTMGDVQVIHR